VTLGFDDDGLTDHRFERGQAAPGGPVGERQALRRSAHRLLSRHPIQEREGLAEGDVAAADGDQAAEPQLHLHMHILSY
jgi:hypothetical protein